MKKTWFLIVFIVATILLASCSTTTGFMVNEEDTSTTFSGLVDEDDYSVTASADYSNGVLARSIEVTVHNKGDVPIILDLNKSAYSGLLGSTRMVDGSTIRMNANLAQPLYSIVPKSSMTRYLYNPSETGFPAGVDLKAGNADLQTRISLCLTIDNKDHYVDIPLIKPVKNDTPYVKIGEISFNFTKWHFLFFGSTKEEIAEKAKAEAVSKYGEGVSIRNIRYDGHWTPLSLLLYFDLLGWVEKITVTADVVKQEEQI